MMEASASDLGAEAAARTELAVDYAEHGIWSDIGYMFRLLALHIRHDRYLGTLLWVATLTMSSLGSFINLQMFQQLAAVTNGLVAGDRGAVLAGLGMGGLFALATGLQAVLTSLINYFLRIRLRTVLTRDLMQKWLRGPTLYQPSQDRALDHPEQRIQEDIFNFALNVLVMIGGVVSGVMSFYVYSGKLWGLSGPVGVAAGIVLPRGLYVMAILWAFVVTVATHLVGRMLTRLDVVRQRLEAGFRHDLGQVREYAEQIVLSSGETIEQARAEHDYRLIRNNWTPYTLVSALLTGITNFSNLIPMLLPPLLLFPQVLAHKMKVGDLAVAGAAFGGGYHAFSSVATLYSVFAILRSSTQRIRSMDRATSIEQPSGFDRRSGTGDAFIFEHLVVRATDERPLFSLDRLKIAAGERWLVNGPSGNGKSTLFRTMAGIWPFGSGTVQRPPANARVMFLPQRAYLPNGTLAEALSYPDGPDRFSEAAYRDVLAAVRLDRLGDKLMASHAWYTRLSPGEQQRVVMARALLQRPDFLFLDEATSSLDPKTEGLLFDALVERLPDTAIITIAHSERLARYHSRQLTIDDGLAKLSMLPASGEVPAPHRPGDAR